MSRTKPTHLRLLQGVAGHGRPINKNEAEVGPSLPEPPEFLTKAAKSEWYRLGPQLEAAGLIAAIDRNQFASYCMMFSIWSDAMRHVAAHGMFAKSGRSAKGLVLSKQYLIMMDTEKRMTALAADFGLTPSSRSKISVPARAKPNDPFEGYLDGA
jgi:P27 family predicted phage terminase small subunit